MYINNTIGEKVLDMIDNEINSKSQTFYKEMFGTQEDIIKIDQYEYYTNFYMLCDSSKNQLQQQLKYYKSSINTDYKSVSSYENIHSLFQFELIDIGEETIKIDMCDEHIDGTVIT
jgi:hypothetical protein